MKVIRKIQPWMLIAGLIGIYDMVTAALSWFLAVDLRFDFDTSFMLQEFGPALLRFLPVYIVCTVLIFAKEKLYRSIWQFVSYEELQRIVLSLIYCSFAAVLISSFWSGWLPRSAYFVAVLIQFVFASLLRFSYRYVQLLKQTNKMKSRPTKRAMIIGAGSAGQILEKDTRSSKDSDLDVVCFIDDDSNKQNRLIDNIPVVGTRKDILKTVKEYEIDTILFAVPSASAEDRKNILNICQDSDCEVRMLPSLIQLANGSIELKKLRKVEMEDLLGRESIQINTEAILSGIGNKKVLVTGAGGSIGSELSRQIAAHSPEHLILVDIYENGVYETQQELKRRYPDLNLTVQIASVRDSKRVNQIFEKHQPQVVFHAAAHKHVPLMENAPCEAVKNNVFGTWKVAKAALNYHAERFVLISTDKAVNPTNIMGATKRICEMIVQTLSEESEAQAEISGLPATKFVCVRFGNVLGSNGSVIPLFQKQIEEGGPVTVTHPDIVRYFMTISEAVSLILEAESSAAGGEIFVLDMGEPVRIADLAKNLIRMVGHVPDGDVKIEYTGLRPGEKLYEEKLMSEEGMKKTENRLIFIGKPIEFDRQEFLNKLPELYQAAIHNKNRKVIEMVVELIGTYSPDWKSFVENGVVEDLKEPEEEEKDLLAIHSLSLMKLTRNQNAPTPIARENEMAHIARKWDLNDKKKKTLH